VWLVAILLVIGCAPSASAESEAVARRARAFSSDHATLVELAFDGELVAPWTAHPNKYIEDQLFYTVGQLNADASVGRLDAVVLSNVVQKGVGDGTVRITYHAVLPVGWGEPNDVPAGIDLVLPRRVTPSGLTAFATSYGGTCIEEAGHTVDAGNFWFHFRPSAAGCELDPASIVAVHAAGTGPRADH